MKKLFLILAFLSAISFHACETDVDLNADFIETPVIYCLLNAEDTIHYVRINRAFLQDNTSAIVLAQDPSEIYYDDQIIAEVEELNGSTVINTFLMERVDGDTLGIPKDTEGTFAAVPNILYRFKAFVNQDLQYRVVVRSEELGINANATTAVVNDFRYTRPSDNPASTTSVNFASTQDYQVRWEKAENGVLYDMKMRFFYREADANNLSMIVRDTFIEWDVMSNFTAINESPGIILDFDVPRDGFFNFLKFKFDSDPTVIRFADSVEFVFSVGDLKIYENLQANIAQSGVTSDQAQTTYTNVNGGLGIWGSRYFKTTLRYPLTDQTRDSIACGSITSELNFAPQIGSTNFPFCN